MKAPRLATIISVVALFVALSGGAYAVKQARVAPKSVGPAKIKDDAVKSRHVSETTLEAASEGDLTTEALTEAGVPVQIHSEHFGAVSEVNNTGSFQGYRFMGPVEVEVPGPVIVRVEGSIRKQSGNDVDFYFRVNPSGGPEVFIDVFMDNWPPHGSTNEPVPYIRTFAVNTAPGTHTFDMRGLLGAGADFTFGDANLGAHATRVTVSTAPPGTQFLLSGSGGGPIQPPG